MSGVYGVGSGAGARRKMGFASQARLGGKARVCEQERDGCIEDGIAAQLHCHNYKCISRMSALLHPLTAS